MADRRIGHACSPDGCLRERLPQLVEIVLNLLQILASHADGCLVGRRLRQRARLAGNWWAAWGSNPRPRD